jgi:hypothetical protein
MNLKIKCLIHIKHISGRDKHISGRDKHISGKFFISNFYLSIYINKNDLDI